MNFNYDYRTPYWGLDEDVNEMFAIFLKERLCEIKDFLRNHKVKEEIISYCYSLFYHNDKEIILNDGTKCCFEAYDNGILVKGPCYSDKEKEGTSFLSWEDVAGHLNALRMLGMLDDKDNEIITLFDESKSSKEESIPKFTFSQELIDCFLTKKGSGVVDGKMRIYEQYAKKLSANENISFLKKEYGIGGCSSAVPYTGVGEDHNGKGIVLIVGYKDDSPRHHLKWNYIEKRIGELIKLDCYLNEEEKEKYPMWLDREEQKRAMYAADREIRDKLYTPPSKDIKPTPKNYKYKYNVGDLVYVDESWTKEIISISDNTVIVADSDFPLFTKEFKKENFERKLSENSKNDRFRVCVSKDNKNGSKYNPIMKEYFEIRDANPNIIILFQLGDFFEAFGDDAKLISKTLDFHLTSRRISEDEWIDMCGFPKYKLNAHIQTLINIEGYTVGISSVGENGEREFEIKSFFNSEKVS